MSNAPPDTNSTPPTPTTNKNLPSRFYVVIPTYETLTTREREAVDEGAAWPVREMAYLPEHETFLDFLIERGMNAWSRVNGGGR
jgi:hypothetical protein